MPLQTFFLPVLSLSVMTPILGKNSFLDIYSDIKKWIRSKPRKH